MTSYEVLNEVNKFLRQLAECQTVISMSESLALRQQDLFDEVVKLLTSPRASVPATHSTTIDWLPVLIAEFKAFKSRNIYRELDRIESALKDFDLNLDIETTRPSVDLLQTIVQKFAGHYEEFVYEQSIPNLLNLLNSGKEFYVACESVLKLLSELSFGLRGPVEIGSEGASELSLLLHPKNDYQLVVSKLESILLIYQELCHLIGVSSSDHPLRISRIESGSLWIKLFGESKAIHLLVDLIREGVMFLHRNYTTEGRLGSIPKRVEGLESILALEARLKEMGYDTVGMKESNQKSATTIAKELNTLLGGETNVVLNDESFSLGSVIDQLIAERQETLLLEEANEEPKQLGPKEDD